MSESELRELANILQKSGYPHERDAAAVSRAIHSPPLDSLVVNHAARTIVSEFFDLEIRSDNPEVTGIVQVLPAVITEPGFGAVLQRRYSAQFSLELSTVALFVPPSAFLGGTYDVAWVMVDRVGRCYVADETCFERSAACWQDFLLRVFFRVGRPPETLYDAT